MENAELISKLSECVPDSEVLFRLNEQDMSFMLCAESIVFGTFKDDMGETIPIIQFNLKKSDIYEK